MSEYCAGNQLPAMMNGNATKMITLPRSIARGEAMTTKTFTIILALILGGHFGCSVNKDSNRVVAKSASLADVRTAISNAQAGNEVVVPAGKATWDSQLIIKKGIKLIGAGIGKTIIRSSWKTSGWMDGLIFYFPGNPERDEPFRVSGLEIDCGGPGMSQALLIRNYSLTMLTRIRIDHNKFYNCASPNMIAIDGYISGVGDNNLIGDDRPFQKMTHSGLGRTSWESTTFQYGSPDQFYWEDNRIITPGMISEGVHGARYCFRFNEIEFVRQGNWSPLFDAHGSQYRPPGLPLYSTMGIEIYENSVHCATDNDGQFVDLRGGMGIIYNNTMTTAGSPFIQVREEFDDRESPPAESPNGEWQHPNQSYFWNNKKAGGTIIMAVAPDYVGYYVDYGGNKGVVPREDREFWQHVESFNGTHGMGVGPRAHRPTSCLLEGAGYWATDENRLYRWNNGAWELYYIPYAYPHPLRVFFSDLD